MGEPGSHMGTVMDLHKTIMSILQANADQALTFEGVVKGVAAILRDDIKDALNELADKDKILRHRGGGGYPSRYQAKPFLRR